MRPPSGAAPANLLAPLLLVLAVSCVDATSKPAAPPSIAAAVPLAASTVVPPAQPPLRPTAAPSLKWKEPCIIVGDNPCFVGNPTTDASGNVYVGGYAYGAFHFAGKDHPRRAHSQAVLASLDAAGQPRWSKAMGTIDDNAIGDLRVIGDRLFVTGSHANGFDAGGKVLPVIHSTPSLANNVTTPFVAAYSLEGAFIWAKNVPALAGHETTDDPYDPQNQLLSTLYADAANGMWISYPSPEGPDKKIVCAAHLDRDGAVLDHYCADGLRGIRAFKVAATMDRNGNLYVVTNTGAMTPVFELWRFAKDGSVRRTTIGVGPTLTFVRDLVAGDDGNVFVLGIASKEQLPPTPTPFILTLIRVDNSGAATTSYPLVWSQPGIDAHDAINIASSVLSAAGQLRVVVAHSIPVVIAGTVVSPISQTPIHAGNGVMLPQPSFTLITVDANKGAVVSYASPFAIDGALIFSSLYDGGDFLLGALQTDKALAAGSDGKSRMENSLVFRLE